MDFYTLNKAHIHLNDQKLNRKLSFHSLCKHRLQLQTVGQWRAQNPQASRESVGPLSGDCVPPSLRRTSESSDSTASASPPPRPLLLQTRTLETRPGRDESGHNPGKVVFAPTVKLFHSSFCSHAVSSLTTSPAKETRCEI